MPRTVRVVDSPEYVGYGGGRPDVEVVETDGRGPYKKSWMGRETLIFLLILALVSLWLYRNSGAEFFGRRMSIGSPIPQSVDSATVNASPASPPLTPVEPPLTAPMDTHAIVGGGQPLEGRAEVMGYAQVLSDSLNLRAGPGYQFYVVNILPRYLTVAVLQQLHIANDGEPWVEVMIDTNQGWQRGWVNRRFLSSCHCPTY